MKNLFKKQPDFDSFTSLIAEGTEFTGNIKFSGTLKIQGKVIGEIHNSENDSCIVIAESGVVHSSAMNSQNIIISGLVQSNTIHADQVLRILKGAEIQGATIFYRSLEIEPGAKLHGCTLKYLDTEEGC